MKREQTLKRRLRSQETLQEAVSAMKSLSAHHFRTARAALAAAREYESGIEGVLAAVGFSQPVSGIAPPGLLLVGADVGLCDGFNSRLAEEAFRRHAEFDFGSIYCVGRRPVASLHRARLAISQIYQSPTGVAGLTRLLLTLAQDVLGDYLENKFASLYVIAARFDGVGEFTPTCTRVLPIHSVGASSEIRRTAYVGRHHLMEVALREYVYIKFFQLLLDSLASEHSTRLVATETAEQWLDSRISETHRRLTAVRREGSTQELLDIVGGAKRSQMNRYRKKSS